MVDNLRLQLRRTSKEYYVQSAEVLKLLMAPLICFRAFGFPDGHGFIEALTGFVPVAFFVLSGYFILDDSEGHRNGRLVRAILRSGIFFLVLLVVYIAVNILNPMSREMLSINILKSKRIWFEFLGLNVWPLPIGDNIWFIQSFLYASIILLILNKTKLLRFYKVWMVLLFIFMLLTGELSGIFRFNVLGYTYIPGGAITRALPYMMFGFFLRERYEKMKKLVAWKYMLIFLVGAELVLAELLLFNLLGMLNYYGHAVGYGVMAYAICGLMIAWDGMEINPVSYYGGRIAMVYYALCNPLYYVVLCLVIAKTPANLEVFGRFGSIIMCVVCLIVSGVLAVVVEPLCGRENV